MALAVITIFGSTIGGLQIHGAETRDEQLDNLLVEYFSEREGEFCKNETTTYNARSLNIEQSVREKSLDEWREELGIQVENVEITYTIKDILTETTSTMELLVYEWVAVEYICEGYEELEELGFGTDHILVFENNFGTWTLVEDAYSEITGYEEGSEEQLEKIALAREAEEDAAAEAYATEMATTMSLANSRALQFSYDADAAVAYSAKWCGRTTSGNSGTMTPSKYNPQYYYYKGADCCNFVSQCLYAGGMMMESSTNNASGWWAVTNTSGTVTADTAYSKSGTAWRYVPSLKSHCASINLPVVRITDASQAVAGNPIFWLKEDGYSSNHVVLIVGTNASGQVLVNGHNSDVYNYPYDLSSKTYYTIDMEHTYGAPSTYTSSGHTSYCCTCNAASTESHTLTMTSNASYHWKKCNECGYTTAKSAHVYNAAGMCKTCGRTSVSTAALGLNVEAE